jgi:hypothetical protein
MEKQSTRHPDGFRFIRYYLETFNSEYTIDTITHYTILSEIANVMYQEISGIQIEMDYLK